MYISYSTHEEAESISFPLDLGWTCGLFWSQYMTAVTLSVTVLDLSLEKPGHFPLTLRTQLPGYKKAIILGKEASWMSTKTSQLAASMLPTSGRSLYPSNPAQLAVQSSCFDQVTIDQVSSTIWCWKILSDTWKCGPANYTYFRTVRFGVICNQY